MKLKFQLILACIFGLTSVMFGALGAHTLKTMVSPALLNSFETGIKYQMYHGIMIFITYLIYIKYPNQLIKQSSNLFIIGIILFSGSIYGLSTKEIHNLNVTFLGPITPVGGFLLILGWIILLIGILKEKRLNT